MKQPIIILPHQTETSSRSAKGSSFIIHEWRGSGPPYLHVHHEDDEAWHVIEGKLTFRFSDRVEEVTKGTTVFVPAGTPHTYSADASSRYLIILTPGLDALINELQSSPISVHKEIMKKYASEIIES